MERMDIRSRFPIASEGGDEEGVDVGVRTLSRRVGLRGRDRMKRRDDSVGGAGSGRERENERGMMEVKGFS